MTFFSLGTERSATVCSSAPRFVGATLLICILATRIAFAEQSQVGRLAESMTLYLGMVRAAEHLSATRCADAFRDAAWTRASALKDAVDGFNPDMQLELMQLMRPKPDSIAREDHALDSSLAQIEAENGGDTAKACALLRTHLDQVITSRRADYQHVRQQYLEANPAQGKGGRGLWDDAR